MNRWEDAGRRSADAVLEFVYVYSSSRIRGPVSGVLLKAAWSVWFKPDRVAPLLTNRNRQPYRGMYPVDQT